MYKFMAIALITLVVLGAYSQEPEGYYTEAIGKTGNELKQALSYIIDDNIEFSYTSSNTDVWDILKESDRDPNNADNVVLVYTNRSVDANQEYNNGAGWTREHVWAKSRGDFGTTRGPGTDLHNLKPADTSINSLRSNRSFSASEEAVYDEGVNTGCFVGNDFTFEPRDAVKGDIARIIFYMATRYEGTNGEIDLELSEDILDGSFKTPNHGVLSELLTWHATDPVDSFERKRNNVIFSYQGNRNPFIDHPEWVAEIWSAATFLPHNSLISEKKQFDDKVIIYTLMGQKVFSGPSDDAQLFLYLNSNTIFVLKKDGHDAFLKRAN